ncbi:MAG: hypothetical protein CMJ25_27880 [Phycisphaerae bacterium]|nr:hypothetical protein [Phycisphaerae bacterium]|tara:strand:- start:2642 stop:2929 length:288 start_codon:yes stop_codon:yes gene_type:complete
MREPSDDWQDEYQSKFLTSSEEDMLLDKVDELICDDIQMLLMDAMAPNEGYKIRQDDLLKLLNKCDGGDFSGFGEYLYIMLLDHAGEEAMRELFL